ncbi:MAG: iron-containing alcohol dehydrogenase [Planctomycetales bacterium]|nr:iron-containing alcohol dehydrogenase [Planctomycetales bacterium]
MNAIETQTTTRVVYGTGQVAALGKLALELSAERVLLVSDPGIVRAGHVQLGLDSLVAAGLETRLFDGVAENPTTEHVAAGVAVATEFRPDMLVGLGGGSSMDCAKGINFLYSCGGEIRDYWGVGKATGPMLPMIAVPTTAGTGSETQSFALISDAKTHQKMACGDRRAAFRVAILDPELTMTQPQPVAALAGFDALSHAVETCVTTKRNDESRRCSREAWQRLAPNYLSVLREPNDLAARGQMQLGACLAGLAIEHSMLGAAHALANPLTAEYGVVHGQAVALMLPHVVRWNASQCELLYCELLEATAGEANCPSGGSEALADFLQNVASEAGLAGKLSECGIERDRLPQLAEDAAKQWTASFNPVPVSQADLLQLYERAY